MLRGSYGNFTRFPGLTELYQRTTASFFGGSNSVVVESPDLKPEQGDSYELTAEYWLGEHFGRLAYFHEDRWDGIVRQTDITRIPNVTNSQNVDKLRYNGVEGVIGLKDVVIDGLDVDANATFTTSEILVNEKNRTLVGKDLLQMPRWRAKIVGTYHPTKDLTLSAALRYKSASYSDLDNLDWNHETFGGNSRYLMVDLRGSWKFAPNWTASAGVNNVNNYRMYLFAPYPQRTFFAELKYDFGADPAYRREEQYRP
jgi:iron complex outermembrane receptor protein